MWFCEEKVFLYGAGINAFGVAKYWGKDDVIAVIDKNEEKIGLDIDGIPIVNMDYYLEHNNGEKIIISAYQKSEEVAKYLDEMGIHDYLIAPYIQAGFPSVEEIIEYIFNRNVKKLIIADNNAISYLILRYIISKNLTIKIVGITENNTIKQDGDLPLVNINSVPDDTYIFYIEEKFSNSNKKNYMCIQKYIKERYFECNEELLQFKNKYVGKRCFIIGTGPSLKMEDLDKLAEYNEICFASNKIYLAFDKTNWRPNFFMVCDFNVYRSCYEEIKKISGSTIFVENFYNRLGLKDIPNAYEVNSIHQKDDFKFSEDIEKYVYSGLTVTYNMLQMAMYMGFSEIYLLGIDFSFSGMSENKGNHFCEEYSKNTKMKGSFYAEESLKAYTAAEEISYKRGVRIYNATRGGKLEVFERKNFDKLF